MSSGSAVIEEIYQLGVAPETRAAAEGAWARAGAGGDVPSTIIATFDGIDGGGAGVEMPAEMVAAWEPDTLQSGVDWTEDWIDTIGDVALGPEGDPELSTSAGFAFMNGDQVISFKGVVMGAGTSAVAPLADLLIEPGGVILALRFSSDAAGNVFETDGGDITLDVDGSGDLVATRNDAVVNLGAAPVGNPVFVHLMISGTVLAVQVLTWNALFDEAQLYGQDTGTETFDAGLILGDADVTICGIYVYHGAGAEAPRAMRYVQYRFLQNIGG